MDPCRHHPGTADGTIPAHEITEPKKTIWRGPCARLETDAQPAAPTTVDKTPCANFGENRYPTPAIPRERNAYIRSAREFAGQLLVSAIAVADQNGIGRGLAEQLGRRRGAARGIDVEVRRIHGDRGPQPGARRTVRLFQRLDSPTGLVAVADRRLVLVIEDGLSQRLEQRHEPRHTVAQRTGGHRQALLAQPPRNPVQPGPVADMPRPLETATHAPPARVRAVRAYGRTAGAVRARRTSRGESAQSHARRQRYGRRIRRLWACTSISMIVVERSPLATYGLPQPSESVADAGGPFSSRWLCECTSSGVPPTPAAGLRPSMAAHPGLLAAAARRTRLGLLLTPATVTATSTVPPGSRQPRPTPSPAPPCAAAIPATTCATARWLWTASWACRLGARFAQLTAQPCILRAQVPDLHTQRHHRATLSRFHMSRGQQLRQTLYLRLQGQRVLRRTPDRLGFLAGLDQLVSIGFKPDGGLKDMMARVTMLAMHKDGQSVKEPTAWLGCDTSAVAPLFGAGFGSRRAHHLPLIPQTPLVRVLRQPGRRQRPEPVGLLAPRQLAVNILHMHHHEQNDSAIPALLQLIEDWTARYHITPLLIETFVETPHTGSFFIVTRQE